MTDHPAFANESFAHLPLGKLPPKHDPRTLRLADYLDEALVLPETPPTADWTLSVRSWPMYGNDRLGDCTVAAAAHMIEAWSAAVGVPKLPTEKAVESAYFATGDHEDSGRFELDVLNYWRHHGVGGDKISAYVKVNAADLAHVRAAVWLFGGVYIGVSLPLTAQRQTLWDVVGDGATGDSEPGSWGGHAIPLHAYDQEGFTCVTWGALLKLTDRFHLAYVDEVYAILSPDWFAASKAPNGFNLAALKRDLSALKG